jgi:hypothetical protein
LDWIFPFDYPKIIWIKNIRKIYGK